MEDKITPYKNSSKGKKEQVQGMFDNISKNYDDLNRVMTFRLDLIWRKNVRKIIDNIAPDMLLDVATGTGDLAIELSKIPQLKITGVDISHGMLEVGRQKIKNLRLENRIGLTLADSEALPFENNSFNAVTVGFGVRNFENLELGLSEILRVLTPGGTLVILETSVPTSFPFKQGYNLYTKFIVPTMGKFLAKDRTAYAYLSESASKFPFGKAFTNILKKVGFTDVSFRVQTLGVATIYIAKKPIL